MPQRNPWQVILCTGAEHLAEEFVRSGFAISKSELNYDGARKFANSDVYTRLAGIEGFQHSPVCVIQSFTCSGENSQHNFTTGDRVVEVLEVLDILTRPRIVEYVDKTTRRFNEIPPPSEIVVLALHLPFSKQDQVYHTGESNACHTVLRTLFTAGASRVVAIDPHVPLEFSWFESYLKEGRIQILSMYPRVIEDFRRRKDLDQISFISTPGKKRSPLAEDLQNVDKQRISTHEVLLEGRIDEHLRGKPVFLVDDMVISGTTIKKARKLLLSQGASEVYGWITHALPYANGKEENLRRLVEAFDEKIFVSNTVRSQTFQKDFPYCCISCVPLVVDELLSKRQ